VHLPFALSPSHFISNVGADAGFAALIGLAILVLLYFAHAREAKTQREELETARQRIEALEHQLASGSVTHSVPVAPRPAVATPASTTAQPAVAAFGLPATEAGKAPAIATASGSPPLAAPAGVGAPALMDATRVVPAFEEVTQGEQTDGHEQELPAEVTSPPVEAPVIAAPLAAAAAAPPTQALSAPGGTGTAAPPSPPSPRAPVRPAVGRTPSPVTAAAGGNGSSPAAGAQALRPGSLLREGLPGQRRRRSLRFVVPLVAAVAVAAAVVLVVVLASGSGGSTSSSPAHHAASSQMALAVKTVVPSSVTVAVLNGTTVNELAHRTGQRLVAKGFKEGQLATASNQSLQKTSVGYLPGHHLAALAVAHALKLTAADVAPAQAADKALACPGTAACSADVIVTVGSDLAHAP
jgi:hypothetical protein